MGDLSIRRSHPSYSRFFEDNRREVCLQGNIQHAACFLSFSFNLRQHKTPNNRKQASELKLVMLGLNDARNRLDLRKHSEWKLEASTFIDTKYLFTKNRGRQMKNPVYLCFIQSEQQNPQKSDRAHTAMEHQPQSMRECFFSISRSFAARAQMEFKGSVSFQVNNCSQLW